MVDYHETMLNIVNVILLILILEIGMLKTNRYFKDGLLKLKFESMTKEPLIR